MSHGALLDRHCRSRFDREITGYSMPVTRFINSFFCPSALMRCYRNNEVSDIAVLHLQWPLSNPEIDLGCKVCLQQILSQWLCRRPRDQLQLVDSIDPQLVLEDTCLQLCSNLKDWLEPKNCNLCLHMNTKTIFTARILNRISSFFNCSFSSIVVNDNSSVGGPKFLNTRAWYHLKWPKFWENARWRAIVDASCGIMRALWPDLHYWLVKGNFVEFHFTETDG